MNITPIQLAKRIERWQKRLAPLGVGHFRIEYVSLMDEVPSGPGAQANVHTERHYDASSFSFRNDYIERAEERDLDETIVHEWLHVAMRDFDESLSTVERWMPEATYEDFESRVNHEREGLIDRLARQIVSTYK